MAAKPISEAFPFVMQRVAVRDAEMAYVDVGTGDPIVLLHGNPTSSYMWRNVIPYLQGLGRVLAPDLIGMGQSGRSPRYQYRYGDQAAYLDAWFEALGLTRNVVLVVHDWGWTSPDLVESHSLLPCRAREPGFEGRRADVSEARVPPARVIEPFDVPANLVRGLGA